MMISEDTKQFIQKAVDDRREFVELCRSRSVKVHVDPYRCLRFYMKSDLVPQGMRLKLLFIFMLAFSSIFLSIILLFFSPWYIVLSVFFFGVLMAIYGGFHATKRTLALAISDTGYFMELRDAGVFTMKPM